VFKYTDKNTQIAQAIKKINLVNAKQKEIDVATSIAFVTMAENGSIDDITATEHTGLFAEWVSGVTYKVSALRQYNEELYRCVQEHTSQDDWTPDAATSLWTKVGNPNEEYPEWSQPVGAHDAYNKGDKVTHGDKKWISTVDSNVWEPGVYGWDEE
jgi:hypothetical protein